MVRRLPLAATLAALVAATGASAVVDQPRSLARLRGLDKVTTRTTTFDVPIGGTGAFGTLAVTVEACFVAPPTAPPESAAFLVVTDDPPAGARATVFSGWMFASSPAVSALDHAVYDVWVIECVDPPEMASAPAQTTSGEQARSAPRRRP